MNRGAKTSKSYVFMFMTVLGHWPALRLFFPDYAKRVPLISNLLALLVTCVAMCVVHASSCVPDAERLLYLGLTWCVGHVAWGTYLYLRFTRSKTS